MRQGNQKNNIVLNWQFKSIENNLKKDSIIALELDARQWCNWSDFLSTYKNIPKTSCVMTSLPDDGDILIGSARSWGDVNIGSLINDALSNNILITGVDANGSRLQTASQKFTII